MTKLNGFKCKMNGMGATPLKTLVSQWSVFGALEDLIDNANDANAKNILITFHKNGKLTVEDDGHGFSTEKFYHFITNFESHTTDNPNSIGMKGCGAKYAMYHLSGYHFFPTNSICTKDIHIESCDGVTKKSAIITMRNEDPRDGDIVFEGEIDANGVAPFTKITLTLHQDHMEFIEHNWNVLITAIERSGVGEFMNIKIKHFNNGVHTLKSHDYSLGRHLMKDETLWVNIKPYQKPKEVEDKLGHHYLFLAPLTATHEKFVRVVATCAAKNVKEPNHRLNGIPHQNAGVYFIKGNRIIGGNNNMQHQLGVSNNRGGVGHFRIAIDSTDNQASELFGISAFKDVIAGSILESPILNFDKINSNDGEGRRLSKIKIKDMAEISFCATLFKYGMSKIKAFYAKNIQNADKSISKAIENKSKKIVEEMPSVKISSSDIELQAYRMGLGRKKVEVNQIMNFCERLIEENLVTDVNRLHELCMEFTKEPIAELAQMVLTT